jgi:hypothetical protein
VTDFVDNQLRSFRSLQSTQIDSWAGLEYAIWVEGPDGHPVFRRPDISCLQFDWLVIRSTGRPPQKIGTYQNDTDWGLRIDPWTGQVPTSEGICRWLDPVDLPVGAVESLEIHVSEQGDVAELLMSVGGSPLPLMAAEMSETSTTTIRYVSDDESVLVFTDPQAADRLKWMPPRPR